MRARWLLVGLAAVVTAGVAVLAVGQRDRVPFVRAELCGATVDDRFVQLEPEQAEHAATITAMSVRRGLPARAATIALATAYQESGLRNLDHGDRDSLGLFQQRPSQGWGTPEEIMDPVYSTRRFYQGLEKVPNYRDLEVTEAAQAVQRSGFPRAYGDHEADARVLASALTGNSPGAFSCQLRTTGVAEEVEGEDGLTTRARAVRDAVEDAFGRQSTGGYAPGGVSTGHVRGSAHYEGRAVDFFYRPIDADNQRLGWATAQYVVARARELDVRTVIYDGRIWTARRSDEGWRPYRVPDRGGDPDVLAHRDHVHVDVA